MASDGHDEISKERWDFSRRRFLRNAGGAVAGGTAYAGLTGALSAEGASAATLAHEAAFASHPKYHFVMVCHVTTNSFFTATQYGIAGCVRAHRLHGSVDGLDELDRRPDGLGDE